MKPIRTYSYLIEIAIFIIGLIFIFLTDKYYIGEILSYIGLSLFIIDRTSSFLNNKKDIKMLAIVFTILSILNLLRHIDLFIFLFGLFKFSGFKFPMNNIQKFIWLIPTLIVIRITFELIQNKNNLNYSEYIKTKKFKFAIGFFLIAFLLELPVFGIHSGFAGELHGHGLWDGWTHIH